MLQLIEQRAKVIGFEGKNVWLQTEKQSTCGQCKLKQGCGTGLLEQHVGQKFSKLSVTTDEQIELDQQVTVSVAEKDLLRSALLMYLLPLVMLILFASTARSLEVNSGVEAVAGVLGLLFGFAVVRLSWKNKESSIVVLVREEKNDTK